MNVKRVVQDNDTTAGMAFDLTIQALIVLSLVTFSVETLPALPAWARAWLWRVEAATVAVFTAEYLLRIAVADNKIRFVFSFFGLVDLIAILPFYLSTGLDLRSVRAVRFLRLFRLFKLARYSRAVQRFHRALRIAREELILFGSVAVLFLYFAAVGIYYFERDVQPDAFGSVFHCLWWAVATLTTVGYGDVYPVTVGGKVFTSVVVMIGLGIVAVPTGIFASALSKARELERDDRADENSPDPNIPAT